VDRDVGGDRDRAARHRLDEGVVRPLLRARRQEEVGRGVPGRQFRVGDPPHEPDSLHEPRRARAAFLDLREEGRLAEGHRERRARQPFESPGESFERREGVLLLVQASDPEDRGRAVDSRRGACRVLLQGRKVARALDDLEDRPAAEDAAPAPPVGDLRGGEEESVGARRDEALEDAAETAVGRPAWF